MHQTHDEDLDLGDVGLIEVAHADTAQNDAQDEEQGEVVVHQGDVTQTLVEQTTGQQEEHGHQQQAAGPEEAGGADLHDAVDAFHEGQPAGHRIHEETEVADEDQQEAVMEQQGEEPQPLGGVVDGAGALGHRVEFTHVGRGVAEQRTEEADFQEHADDHTELGVGAVPLFMFDEVQRLFLTPGRGDAERHGRFGPVNHAPDDAQEEGDYRHIGQNHAEQVRQTNGQAMAPMSATTSNDANIPYLASKSVSFCPKPGCHPPIAPSAPAGHADCVFRRCAFPPRSRARPNTNRRPAA